jgi:hypothetical protein
MVPKVDSGAMLRSCLESCIKRFKRQLLHTWNLQPIGFPTLPIIYGIESKSAAILRYRMSRCEKNMYFLNNHITNIMNKLKSIEGIIRTYSIITCARFRYETISHVIDHYVSLSTEKLQIALCHSPGEPVKLKKRRGQELPSNFKS